MPVKNGLRRTDTLFRQPGRGEWDAVFERMAQALRAEVGRLQEV
jgi:hypothetical protein